MNVYCVTIATPKKPGFTLEQHVKANDEAEAIALVEALQGVSITVVGKPSVKRPLTDDEEVEQAALALARLG